MNGINKITDRIAAEAQEEIAAIQTEAREKCREIKESYDKQAQDEYWRLLKEGAKDGELQAKRLSGAAVLEAKKSILSMKQEAVTKILEEAADRICSLPDAEYIAFLSRLAGEAAFTGTEEIIFNARDKAAFSKQVVKGANEILKKRGLMPKLTVSQETGDFKGGLMVKQGDIEVNCCVETLIEMNRDKLASQIAEILFAE